MITTSNFARSGSNPNAVAISVGVPKNWIGNRYWRLAPAFNTLQAGKEEFDSSYYKRLSELNAKEVYDDKAVIILALPTYTGGYEKFFDNGGRITWKEPEYNIFNPEEDYPKVVDYCRKIKPLVIMYEETATGWKYQKFQDIRSVGMAIDLLTKKAKAELEGAEYTDENEWQNLQSCVGSGSIPKECADTIKKAVKKMVDDGIIDAHKKWQSIYYLCDKYLNGETK